MIDREKLLQKIKKQDFYTEKLEEFARSLLKKEMCIEAVMVKIAIEVVNKKKIKKEI